MSKVELIGKKGSKSCRAIVNNTNLNFFSGKNVDALLNYGLSGDRYYDLRKKYPKIDKIPVINRVVGRSKYDDVVIARRNGIMTPDSCLEIQNNSSVKYWIEKRIHSIQGRGIKRAYHRRKIDGKYYQRMVEDRIYELRVHSFLWMPTSRWMILKRLGPSSQIAWNFHQGGHFSRIIDTSSGIILESKKVSKKVLNIFGMAFGAVDFIVSKSMGLCFIEINSCPGFTELSEGVYYDAMNKLSLLTPSELIEYGN
jgi:hypothetical protein